MKKIIASVVVTGLLLSNPLVSNAALGDRTLKSGMTHKEVKQLQEVLKKKEYFKSNNTTTYFGTVTKSAVVKFQKSKGLKADGIVGQNTYKALGIKKQTAMNNSSNKSTAIVKEAKKHLNVRYVWGGTTPKGFDCSGFLKYVFEKSADVTLPRTVSEIYKKGTKVSKPQVGDVVFFETYKSGASHAGIYIGGNQFIHSSSSGVTITSMDNSYWEKRYLGAKRM
ncbi:D-gamma-glutamyl-meso-diaminopimelic acid endopeptidase CwlS [Peribacillus sp. Bi96]|uniref:C40 family peptidase n=1 Tax=unclassified Peribacillus TaxID=2675266 RepID=UPI001DAACDD0|nr:NlpC/P60 family protein [Peribacillus sp. Bi96]CAH0188675.1 D-gamma-glutamyl-meso-diaminopimelic acid endopeptidase CwlS [Peribacillus sp. Bi96]